MKLRTSGFKALVTTSLDPWNNRSRETRAPGGNQYCFRWKEIQRCDGTSKAWLTSTGELLPDHYNAGRGETGPSYSVEMNLKSKELIENREKIHSLLCMLKRAGGGSARTCGAAETPSNAIAPSHFTQYLCRHWLSVARDPSAARAPLHTEEQGALPWRFFEGLSCISFVPTPPNYPASNVPGS